MTGILRAIAGSHREFTAGELLGMTPFERLGARIETDRAAVLLADVFIDDIERKSPCEPFSPTACSAANR